MQWTVQAHSRLWLPNFQLNLTNGASANLGLDRSDVRDCPMSATGKIEFVASPRPEVTFGVVLTRNAERAARCLRSVAAQGVAAEVVVVLCEPDAGIRQLVAEQVQGAAVIDPGADIGLAFGWQEVLDAARGPLVHFLHEDTVLAPGCTSRLVETLRAEPDVGAVGARTLNPDGSPQACGWILWSDAAASALVEPPGPEPFAVDSCQGACLVVDAAKLRATGGFDARFFPVFYVDANLCMQLWYAGHAVLCDPRAQAVHERGATIQDDAGPFRGRRFRQFLVDRHRQEFARKWGEALRGHASRADALDARYPTREEVASSLCRAAERRRLGIRLEVPRPLPRPPADLAEHARRLRDELHAAFAEELIRRESAQDAEVERLHQAYAALLAGHGRALRGASRSAGSALRGALRAASRWLAPVLRAWKAIVRGPVRLARAGRRRGRRSRRGTITDTRGSSE